MLSLVLPKEPDPEFEPATVKYADHHMEIQERSWDDFMRGRYHETQKAPPLSVEEIRLGAPTTREQQVEERHRDRRAQVYAILTEEYQSTRTISMRLGLNWMAVREACRELVAEGEVESETRRSTRTFGVDRREVLYRRRRITPQD
jgi:hypothetical protein